MHTAGAFVVAAMLSEAVWETGKMVWQKGKISADRVGALAVGLVIAIGASMDLFVLVGISFSHPLIGQIMTGILLSRGANFVHDLLKRAEGIVQSKKEGQPTQRKWIF
jgi:hypothetical protein